MALTFGKVNRSASFNPTSAFPLDARYYFESYTAAEKAAKDAVEVGSSEGTYYFGQNIVVVENGEATLYLIQPDATLKEVGSVPVGDGKSITVEDGQVKMVGFAEAAEGAQPRKNADGEIEWVVPSTDTVDGLQTTVSTIQSDLDTVEADVAAIEATIGTVEEGKTVVQMLEETEASLQSEIETAAAQAKQEAIDAILGENVDADFDTLQEVAAWIQSDTTSSTELINRVSAIEADYLKQADKTELRDEIDELAAFVGGLPEGAASTTVIDYIQEVVDGLNIGDYAKAADLTALDERVTTAETKLETIDEGAQVNVIDSVDETQFAIDESKKLTLLDIALSKVTGLSDALANKVDKNGTDRLMTEKEAEKLEKLVISEDGSVEVSGTIAAGNVDGLAEWITSRAATLKGLSENNFTDELKALLETVGENAEENIIETLKIGGTAVEVNADDKSVNIPVASATTLGVVKGSDAENGVAIAEDGTMTVKSVNINALTQTEGETLILNGGSSAD